MENSYPKIFTESFNLKPVRRAIYLLVSDAMQFHVQFITAFLCGLPLSSVLLLVVFLCGCYAVPCSVPCSLPVWDAMQFYVQFVSVSLCGLPLSSVQLLVASMWVCYAVPCSVACSLPVRVVSVLCLVTCSLPVWVVVQEALLGGWDGGESGRGKVVSRTYSYSPVCLVGRLGWGSAAKFCCDVLHL